MYIIRLGSKALPLGLKWEQLPVVEIVVVVGSSVEVPGVTVVVVAIAVVV